VTDEVHSAIDVQEATRALQEGLERAKRLVRQTGDALKEVQEPQDTLLRE
jgi:hypothetical protein